MWVGKSKVTKNNRQQYLRVHQRQQFLKWKSHPNPIPRTKEIHKNKRYLNLP